MTNATVKHSGILHQPNEEWDGAHIDDHYLKAPWDDGKRYYQATLEEINQVMSISDVHQRLSEILALCSLGEPKRSQVVDRDSLKALEKYKEHCIMAEGFNLERTEAMVNILRQYLPEVEINIVPVSGIRERNAGSDKFETAPRAGFAITGITAAEFNATLMMHILGTLDQAEKKGNLEEMLHPKDGPIKDLSLWVVDQEVARKRAEEQTAARQNTASNFISPEISELCKNIGNQLNNSGVSSHRENRVTLPLSAPRTRVVENGPTP